MNGGEVIDRDMGWKDVVARLEKAKNSYVDAGWWGPTRHPQGDATLAEIASVHEYGAGRIPARPFLRPAYDSNVERYNKLMNDKAGEIIDGKVSIEEALSHLGEVMVSDVQKGIDAVTSPPLSPITLARRRHGGSKPLIDTGALRASCSSRVIINGQKVKGHD